MFQKKINLKNGLWIVALFTGLYAFGQHDEKFVDGLVAEITQNLEQQEIVDYFVAKRYCSGNIEMFTIGDKLCTSKGTYIEAYVVWKGTESSYLKKVDNCGMYATYELANTMLFDTFDNNRASLKSEAVLNYKSNQYTGTPELRTKPQSCFRAYAFTESGKVFTKIYNVFDLSNDSKGKNLNYDYNKRLKLVLMDDMLTQLLLEIQGDFKRVK